MSTVTSLTVEVSIPIPVRPRAKRFYRPELDALRFFAFAGVLMTHGPHAPGAVGAVANAGSLGLPMFFMLSAFLITELLMREREQTGTISWGRFFTRRALRIWPLYYVALATSAFIVIVLLGEHWLNRKSALVFLFFVANWVPHQIPPCLGPLWSISVEEQFYLIWPPIMRYGGRKLAWGVSALLVVIAAISLWVLYPKGWVLVWFSAPVQFLFFAVGTMIALWTRGEHVPLRTTASRVAGVTAGAAVCLLVGAVCIARTQPDPHISLARFYVGYGGAALGCALIFVSLLGVSRVPKPLPYLGKISYGLYVFHVAGLKLGTALTSLLNLSRLPQMQVVVTDLIAVLSCIAAAHLSYRYFETPFLKLKQRFEVVKSRPV